MSKRPPGSVPMSRVRACLLAGALLSASQRGLSASELAWIALETILQRRHAS